MRKFFLYSLFFSAICAHTAYFSLLFADTPDQEQTYYSEDSTMNHPYTELLFSYGTLQYDNVQITTFGRKLKGYTDILPMYAKKTVQIIDPDVIAKSGEAVHSIIEYTADPQDQIPGVVFEISTEELLQADKYEVADYKRVKARLLSGKSAWVYVNVQSKDPSQ